MQLTIELYQQAYEQLGNEFGQQFKDAGQDFRTHFIEASDNVKAIGFGSGDEYIEAVRVLLQDVLRAYARTKATTRVGQWLRWAAVGIARILPFIKINKK